MQAHWKAPNSVFTTSPTTLGRRAQSIATFTLSSCPFTGEIALHEHLVHLIASLLLCQNLHITDALFRAGNHWWVSDQLGKKDGFMRAAVGEADQKLPPVKGWEAYKPGKLMFWKGKWSLKDQTLECSCDPSAESAGQVVC